MSPITPPKPNVLIISLPLFQIPPPPAPPRNNQPHQPQDQNNHKNNNNNNHADNDDDEYPLPASATPPAALLNREADGEPYYITLTVTRPTTTYTTTILLGDNYATSLPNSDSEAVPTPQIAPQHPGITTGSIVGIVIGVLGGLSVLCGVFYVYMLRARQWKRLNGKKRKKRKKGAGSSAPPPAAGGGEPPAPEAAAPA